MVQQCLMHPTPSGIRNGDGYDWGAVAADLSKMMALADEKVKEGSLIDAAEIARYVMTLTCAEYEADHPYGETYGGEVCQVYVGGRPKAGGTRHC